MMDWKTVVGFTVLFHGIVYAWKKEWVLRMDTRKFNSPLNSIGQHGIRKYFRVWFRMGTYATIIVGFPFTIFLFVRTIYYSIFPSIVAVAIAVTPSSFLSTVEPPLELHHPPLSPYPDADILVEDPGVDSSVAESSDPGYLAIQPILPGWNLPLTHLPYYILAILISVVIHELGHAIASSSHKIPIQSVGLSIFGPLIPAAHVELNSLQLRETPIRKQLDILTAGVWMNLYLAIITYFIVPMMLPGILYPTHTMGRGIAVVHVLPSSGIGGPGGLDSGDVIIGIENCPVYDIDSWYTCLEKIWESDPVGYCVTNDTLSKFANNSEGCCNTNGDNSHTHLCFLQMDNPQILTSNSSVSINESNKDSAHLNSNSSISDHPLVQKPHNYTNYCLPAQPVVNLVSPPLSQLREHLMSESESGKFIGWEGRCHSPSYSCAHFVTHLLSSLEEQESNANTNTNPNTPNPTEDSSIKEEITPGMDLLQHLAKDSTAKSTQDIAQCFVPRLVHNLKRFRIVQIQRHQSSEDEPKSPVLYVGNVYDLYQGVRASEYVPRNWFLSRILGFSGFSKLPEKLETVLLLTAGLSAGLAVVNMLPIYGLDGYHIVEAVARSYFTKKWEPRKISKLVQGISWIAMAIAFLTVFCSIAQAL